MVSNCTFTVYKLILITWVLHHISITWSISIRNLYQLSRLMTKPTKWYVRPGKTQISLGIWRSSLCTRWVVKDPRFLHAASEDWSDWADAQADLSLRWAHMSFCWFCHEAAQLCIGHGSLMKCKYLQIYNQGTCKFYCISLHSTNWAASRENLSSGFFNQVRLKPVCSPIEAS